MLVGLLKKPIFWIGLIILLIIVILILIFEPKLANTPKNSQSSPQKISQKPKSGLKPGTCLVLEQKYCNKGKLVEWKSPVGPTLKLIAFNLPEGVPIFSPFNGAFTYSNGPGNLIDSKVPAAVVYKPITSKDPSSLTFMITGDIDFNSQQLSAKKNDVVAQTKSTGVKVLGNTIILIITKINNSKITTDEDLFNKFLNSK